MGVVAVTGATMVPWWAGAVNVACERLKANSVWGVRQLAQACLASCANNASAKVWTPTPKCWQASLCDVFGVFGCGAACCVGGDCLSLVLLMWCAGVCARWLSGHCREEVKAPRPAIDASLSRLPSIWSAVVAVTLLHVVW